MQAYRIAPESAVDLTLLDPRDRSAFEGGKSEAKTELKTLNARLEELQELLYAEGRRRVLIVLQGMDAAGKDGTIRRVFDGVNPQGVRVTSFKAPTGEELAHDFLWRVHPHVPGNGYMMIFNRSHYEDVLIAKVRSLAPDAEIESRYASIRDFERLLAGSGTTILKFFLHISKEEQRERLQARVDNPRKRWKFNPTDLEERLIWDDYQRAFETAISKTSTDYAPWWVIPADSKWYRDLVITRILVEALEQLAMKWPEALAGVEGTVVE